MDYSIDFKDAVYLLRAYSIAERLPIASNPELTAIITHWLHSPESPPIYGDRAVASKWRRLLSAHALAAKDKTWTGEPNRSSQKMRDVRIKYGGIPFTAPARPKFTFAELFAGIGGFRIALQRVGGKCVFSSEIDNSARQTYFQNYGEYPFGDIKQFTATRITDSQIERVIPNHEVLAAGFPCQPFSQAGVSARRHLGQETGFDCEIQGTLFFDIVRIARIKRPRVILLENVRNLLRHDDKKTLEVMQRTVEEELQYSFNCEVLDASSLVPQRRERCYIVCFRDRRVKFSFPCFKGAALPLKSILEDMPDDRYTISDKLWTGHQNRSKRNRDRNTGFVAVTAELEKPANTLIARYGKDGKECLIPQDNKNPRLLTPRECARLQGFPENFVLPEYSHAAYRQFGNTIAIPVVEIIAKRVISKIRKNGRRRSDAS